MVIIVCPQCRTEYDVPLKVLEREVACKSCGHSFRARSRKSARQPAAKNPVVWALAGLGAALFAVVILIVESNIDRGGQIEPAAPQTAVAESAAKPADQAGAPALGADRAARSPAVELCAAWIAAVADSDVDRLQKMISFPLYHNFQSGGGAMWSDLEPVDQVLKMQSYVDALVADTPEGSAFARHAVVESIDEVAGSDQKAEVGLVLHRLADGRRQKRALQLARIGDAWIVAGQTVGPEYGGEQAAADDGGPRTLDEKFARRTDPEGAIATVEYLPETDEPLRRSLDELVAALLKSGGDTSMEARERLVEIGKPAIPALLNCLVPLDYSNSDDIAKANKYISVLRLITGKSFGFAPGFQDVAVRGSMEADLRHAVQLWFGWWNRYKDTWQGRDLQKEQEEW